MNKSFSADVIIVGAGPVGLTLATDLSQRGISAIILERRTFKEPPSVKCNHVSARSMEQFRRLGVASKLRNTGLPPDFPNDVVFGTSMTGIELTRIRIPGRATRFTDTSGPDGWWPTPEPPHRINQIYLEPILLEHASAEPNVTLLNRVEMTSFSQDEDRVSLQGKNVDTDEVFSVTARYLIGCDGGSSNVRKGIGAKLQGTAVIQLVQSTYIRAPGLLKLLPGAPAWCTYAVNPRRTGTVFAIDGKETWLVHNHLRTHETEFEQVDRDASIRNILGVDKDFEYELINKEDWVGRRLVSDRFRDRRVFICGDACHLWVPYAGYGMNAGIADATNLAWHLSARLRGWGTDALLDAYEQERQPITEQVSKFAMNHAAAMIKARGAVPERIEETSSEGDAIRAANGREAYDLNVQQFCCAGLNFGYYYDKSPLIVYDGAAHPDFSMGGFTASTVPGCRAPHFWLTEEAGGGSLYDALGSDYTLLSFDSAMKTSALEAAFAAAGVPLKVLDLSGVDNVPLEYEHKLVLCRIDQQVAWRSDAPPVDPKALVEKLRGAASS